MEAEIKRLAPRAMPGIRLPRPTRVDTQTLLYPFDETLAYFAVSCLRTPTRVLWDVLELHSARLEPLYDEVREALAEAPPPWLSDGTTISVRVPDACDFPASGLQIRGTIKNAIIEAAAGHGRKVTLDPEAPDVELLVRGRQRPLVLSLDLAGRAMHERGWRKGAGEAPLKETLAAQMLILARWDPRTEVLLDPLAGAGTIAIEAALAAIAAPVWVPPRRPAADRLPLFSAVRARTGIGDRPLFGDARPRIVAHEIHTPVLERLRANAARAGVESRILSMHGDLRDLGPERLAREIARRRPPGWPEDRLDPTPGLLIANPPYGERLREGRGRDADLEDLYEDLRDLCLSLGRGWRAAFIVANPAFEPIFSDGPRLVMKKPMWNGQIPAQFLLYEV